jgi:hypothetical protein
MEAVYSSEKLEQTQYSTWCKIPKHRSHINNHRHENLKTDNISQSSSDKIPSYINVKPQAVYKQSF